MGHCSQITKTNNPNKCGLRFHIIALITGISMKLRLRFVLFKKEKYTSILFAGLFTLLTPTASSVYFETYVYYLVLSSKRRHSAATV